MELIRTLVLVQTLGTDPICYETCKKAEDIVSLDECVLVLERTRNNINFEQNRPIADLLVPLFVRVCLSLRGTRVPQGLPQGTFGLLVL